MFRNLIRHDAFIETLQRGASKEKEAGELDDPIQNKIMEIVNIGYQALIEVIDDYAIDKSLV